MLLSVTVCKHELWLSAPKVLAASIDRVRLLPIGIECWMYGDRIVRRFGDRLWGGEFLECAIEGLWEAIGQWLQFFTTGDRGLLELFAFCFLRNFGTVRLLRWLRLYSQLSL
ncbi:hypothetical protein [Microcoleus sp. S13_C3]|uniref:hypothetical protein n=1 Tax=Microcoleus sp. S13_C3 TaxID=3055409 RepID=UPI002FD6DA3A